MLNKPLPTLTYCLVLHRKPVVVTSMPLMHAGIVVNLHVTNLLINKFANLPLISGNLVIGVSLVLSKNFNLLG